MKLRILYPIHAPRFTYIHSNNSIKPGHTFLISGFIRYITSESIAIEATDIDFMYTPNVNVVHNMHDSPSTTVSGHHSDFDMIIDEIESQVLQTSQAPKKGYKLTTSSHGSHSTTFMHNLNKLSDLALDCLDLNINNDVYVYKPKSDNDDIEPNDEASDLEEQKPAKKPAKKQRQTKKKRNKIIK
ncbi:25763_t:CDS:2 [Gigaspora margarita]|uniref:25763_t:CDS:1 n=1 Tax=Gigaspora margarita TaxID=4874 RepID=A0ABN7V1M2_GIGMA|nr:25763_t:CDS:2 [Gigaspora margarita]